ncbi:MAG: DUF1257 domain-containing protein [Planctomycetaceae bacterium]|nr:DUF1257 domain-containing protein [Planctomycetaceae bacterium]
MSHIATVELEIKDLDALELACTRIGVELVRGQERFKNYNGRRSPCNHAIRVPGNHKAYEIGVRETEGGKFELAFDLFQGGHGLQKFVGRGCNNLKQAYAVEVAKKQALRQGFRVAEKKQDNGSIRLVLTK